MCNQPNRKKISKIEKAWVRDSLSRFSENSSKSIHKIEESGNLRKL